MDRLVYSGSALSLAADDPQAIREAYLARTRLELGQLDAAGFLSAGTAMAPLLLVKGQPGPAELAGEGLLAGPDGDAIQAAIGALGWGSGDWAALGTFLAVEPRGGVGQDGTGKEGASDEGGSSVEDAASGPSTGSGSHETTVQEGDADRVATGLQVGWRTAEPRKLAWAVEVLDPEAVIALDLAAADALRAAWGLGRALDPGDLVRVSGRRVLVLEGFEASLADPTAKQAAWRHLKRLTPLGAPI